MSNSGSDSDISAKFNSFLASIDTGSVSADIPEWESFLAAIPTTTSAKNGDPSESVLSVSPEIQEWESFLAGIPTSSKRLTISVPPSGSEHNKSSSELPRDSSSDDDYHPSPVPKPLLYEPAGLSSSDGGDGNILHAVGELIVELFRIFLINLPVPQIKYQLILCFGAMWLRVLTA
jgi:hypothetical protein